MTITRKGDTTRKKNTRKTYQLMFSVFTCLTSECGQSLDESIKLIAHLYPYSHKIIFNKLVFNAEKYDKNLTEFHRDIATTLIAHFGIISSDMLKDIIKKRKSIN